MFGDIAGNCQLNRLPILVLKGSGVSLHVTAQTFQSDYVELKRSLLATADIFVEVAEPLTIVRGDNIVDTLANDITHAIGAN